MTVSFLKSMLPVPCTHYSLALRVEWCRSRARAMRWSEELLLVLEEMRRVCAFLIWRADWWIEQARIMVESPLVSGRGWSVERIEGLSAYAMRQASMFRAMSSRCSSIWASSIAFATTIPLYNKHRVPEAPPSVEV
jgi:hypothetical protein